MSFCIERCWTIYWLILNDSLKIQLNICKAVHTFISHANCVNICGFDSYMWAKFELYTWDLTRDLSLQSRSLISRSDVMVYYSDLNMLICIWSSIAELTLAPPVCCRMTGNNPDASVNTSMCPLETRETLFVKPRDTSNITFNLPCFFF